MGEKKFGNEFRNKEFISKIWKQLMQLNVYIFKKIIPLAKMDQRSKWAFVQRRHPGGHIKHLKRCLASLTIGEMQIKTGPPYHLTPLRTAIPQKIYKD